VAFKLPGFAVGSLSILASIGVSQDLTAVQLSSASRYCGTVFMARVSEPMNGFLTAITAVTGTVTNGLQADLYAVDTTGKPTGASLATVTVTPAVGAMTITWGTPYTVTAGTCYFVRIINVAGTPASNNFSINCSAAGSAFTCYYAGNLLLTSNDSGANWQSYGVNINGPGWQGSLCFAPTYGTFGSDAPAFCTGTGYAISNTKLYNAAGSRTARSAMKVNFEMDLLLWGVVVPLKGNVGSPTYDIQAEVCSASASLSVSDSTINGAGIADSTRIGFRWAVPYRLLANTDYYIGVTPVAVGNGTASVYSAVQICGTILKTPTSGPIKGFYESTAYGNPSWTQESSTKMCHMIFQVEVPGGMKINLGMNGGLNG